MSLANSFVSRDWKKLTFYYFADSYINFNSLVTDLFKIYKTRIWMSAINPASFASPGSAIGLQAPSGVGPGAVSVDLLAQLQERRQNAASTGDKAPAVPMPSQNVNAGGRGLRTSNSHSSFNDALPVMQQSAYNPTANYSTYNNNLYGSFNTVARPGAMGYGQMMPTTDQFPSAYSQANDYHLAQAGRGRYPGSPAANGHQDQGFPHMGSQQDMFAAFQGLSLGGQR